MTHFISSLPKNERPRERCLRTGPDSLSLRECLAILLGSGPRKVGCLGLAEAIIARPGRGLNPQDEERAFFTAMESSGFSELNTIAGIGPARRAKILAAFEIARRYSLFRGKRNSCKPAHRPRVADFGRSAIARVPEHFRQDAREWLGFVAFHRSGELGELSIVERGVRTHVNIDPAELFARLLALRPRGFFLFHNHPSGDTTASIEDQELTVRVERISTPLGVRLLGHGIVSAWGNSWVET